MISFGCLCGYRWENDHLKGKSDEDLLIEVQEMFSRHQHEMEAGGW